MNEEVKKLKKGIVYVLIANLINLGINLITNFIMPKYLTIDSYANIKTYQLYSAYLGVLSLGYVDGMFLKYGGIEFEKINKKELNINISTFRIFQLIVTIILLIIGIFIREYIYMAFVISILPVNMAGYFKSLYQSIGEFKQYSKIMNLTTISTFIINTMLLICKNGNYMFFVAGYVFLYILIWLYLEYYLYNCTKMEKWSYNIFSMHEVIMNIKDGILLMLGNFSNTILTSMDRWFIKILMYNIDFAQYSFACSMENFVNVAITPITVTLYNYLCKNSDISKIKRIRNLAIIFASFIISCAFPGKFILENYLKDYLEAAKVMFYLFDAQMFYIIIKSVYINLYKSKKRQKQYFTKLIIVIIIGFIFNVICFNILKTKEAFAIGTLLTSIIWFILSVIDFKYLNYSFKEALYVIIASMSFMFFGYKFSAITGFCLYIVTILICCYLLLNDDFIYIINNYLKRIKKKLLKI